MKKLLLTYGLKILVWLLEKAITKISETSKNSSSTEPSTCDDVLINPDTAKKFTKFIKSHTIKKQNENG